MQGFGTHEGYLAMEGLGKKERSFIAKSAFKVMVGGALSLSAGLINQVVIAAAYGASPAMDAYLTALVIPSYLQLVLLSALSYVFIPSFVQEQTSGKEEARVGAGGHILLAHAWDFVLHRNCGGPSFSTDNRSIRTWF